MMLDGAFSMDVDQLEDQMPEQRIGRRASDQLITEVARKQEELAIEQRQFQKDIREAATTIIRTSDQLKTLAEFHSAYLRKSEEIGDPHIWIREIGKPTARDFNKLKTQVLTVMLVLGGVWAFIRAFGSDIWHKLTS